MKTVAIISQKGGAGKTTLTINLAVEALLNKLETVIVDLDPQSSSSEWSDSRTNKSPIVVSSQHSRLLKVLETAKQEKVDLVFIDTAPHSEKTSLEAARNSDLILVPCRPTILDLRAIGNTLDIASLAKTKSIVILNTIPPRGSLSIEAEEAVKGYNAEICPIKIGHRTAFIHSITEGLAVQEYEPNGKAALEIKQLFKWLKNILTIN